MHIIETQVTFRFGTQGVGCVVHRTDAFTARIFVWSTPLLVGQAVVGGTADQSETSAAARRAVLAGEGLPRGALVRHQLSVLGRRQSRTSQCYETQIIQFLNDKTNT